ncbi:hypothetical protein LBMAG56_17050 [Verrucomicrobiota bacterium]|nr:hypothetical protein LBMAG56_17050 [Verrucomicrobiota bacterium]
MKKPVVFEPLVQTHISDWLREMWEVEALHPPMIGSRLKFGLPMSPPKPKRAVAKTGKRRAAKK